MTDPHAEGVRPQYGGTSVFIVFYVTGKRGQHRHVSSVHKSLESAERFRHHGDVIEQFGLWGIAPLDGGPDAP